MNHEFLPEARDELGESALYYDESKENGLGVRFRNEVAHVIEHIVVDPYLSFAERLVVYPSWPFVGNRFSVS